VQPGAGRVPVRSDTGQVLVPGRPYRPGPRGPQPGLLVPADPEPGHLRRRTAMLKTTPLNDFHVQRGATMTDFAGWSMPLRYGGETVEHRAVRSAAGLFDLTHMGEVSVTGPQAAAALDYALVSNIAAIKPRRAKYTMICNEDGGVLDDLVVYRLDDDSYFIVANAANVDEVVTALQHRVQGFDASVRDSSPDWALIAVQGPVSAEVLRQLTRGT